MSVLCAGIIVADHACAPIARMPAAGELVTSESMPLCIGGCAANAAVDLVKMGVRTAIVGRVGNDVFGRCVTEMLRDAQVDVSLVTASPTAETSQTLIVNVQGEDRRFIHTFGANGEFSAADIPRNRLRDCKVLYVGGYLLMQRLRGAELAEVFAEARALGVKTVLDVVIPGPGDYLPWLKPLLPQVDVFLPNQHEGELITGEKDALLQASIYHRLGARTAVVTMGGDGAILVRDDMRLRSGVFSVPFVDGSGGGDAFDAGYIFGLLHDKAPADCLRYASALGASCVRALGATPGVFTRGECEEFLRTHELRVERI